MNTSANDPAQEIRKITAVFRAVAFMESTDAVDELLDTLTASELEILHRASHELTSLATYAMARRQPRIGQRRTESIRLLSQDQPYTGDLPLTGGPYPQS